MIDEEAVVGILRRPGNVTLMPHLIEVGFVARESDSAIPANRRR